MEDPLHIFLTISIPYLIIHVVTTGLFFARRRNVFIEHRTPGLTIMASCAGLVLAIVMVWNFVPMEPFRGHVSCAWWYAVQYYTVPLNVVCVFARIVPRSRRGLANWEDDRDGNAGEGCRCICFGKFLVTIALFIRLTCTFTLVLPHMQKIVISLRSIELVYAYWSNQNELMYDQQLVSDTTAISVEPPTALQVFCLVAVQFFRFEWLPSCIRHRTERRLIRGGTVKVLIPRSYYLLRAWGTLIFSLSLSTFLYLAAFSVARHNFLEVTVKHCDRHSLIPLLGMGGVFMLNMPILYFMLRSIKDNFHIRLELIATLTVFLLCTVMYTLAWLNRSNELHFKLTAGNGVDFWVFMLIAGEQLTTIVIPLVFSVIYQRRMERIVREGGMENFRRLLEDRDMFADFRQFLANDLCIENGLFYEDYKLFTQSFPECNSRTGHNVPDTVHRPAAARHMMYCASVQPSVSFVPEANPISSQTQEDPPRRNPEVSPNNTEPSAELKLCWRVKFHRGELTFPESVTYLVHTYIRPGAPYELNLTQSTRKQILQDFTEEAYPLRMFERAVTEVTDLMFRNTFPRWIQHSVKLKRRKWERTASTWAEKTAC